MKQPLLAILLCISPLPAYSAGSAFVLQLLGLTPGQAEQIGIVGPNIEDVAMQYHLSHGIDRYYSPTSKAKYAAPYESTDVTFWFGYKKGSQQQIELIAPNNFNTQDTYVEFSNQLPTGVASGIHHYGHTMKVLGAYDRNARILKSYGFDHVISGTLKTPISDTRFSYYDTRKVHGAMLELIENRTGIFGLILVGFTPLETAIGAQFGAYTVVKQY